MQDVHDFVALHALFNIELHNALLKKNVDMIKHILLRNYKEDMETIVKNAESLDIDKALLMYQESLTDPRLMEIFL